MGSAEGAVGPAFALELVTFSGLQTAGPISSIACLGFRTAASGSET